MAHRIDGSVSANVATVKPAAGAVGAVVGYFAAAASEAQATVMTFAWANMVQEEIAGVVVGAGLSLDKANDGQLLTAINTLIAGTQAVAFAASDVGGGSISGTTTDTLAIICTWASTSVTSANGGVAIACGGGSVSGTGALLAASTAGTIAGTNCVGMALSGSAGSFNASASNCAMIGSASGSSFGASARRAVVLGSDGCDVGVSFNAYNAACVAALNCELGANRSAIIASSGSTTGGSDVLVEAGPTFIAAARGSTTHGKVEVKGSASYVGVLASADTEITNGAYLGVVASGRDASGYSGVLISGASNNVLVGASTAAVVDGTGVDVFILGCAESVSAKIPEITGTGQIGGILASTGAASIGTGAVNALIFCATNDSVNKTQVTGAQSFIGGVRTGGATVSGSASALVCSTTSGAGPTLSSNNILAGASGTALTWQLDSSSGMGTFQDLTLTSAFDATTGGSAASAKPNLPTGATGTNFRWIKVNDGSADYWVPAWSNA